MRAVIRVDAGPRIGLGHLHRCVSLARAMPSVGLEPLLLVRGEEADAALASRLGVEATWDGPTDESGDWMPVWKAVHDLRADAVVIDSRSLLREALRGARRAGAVTVAIDDMAEVELPVDIVVNPNVYASAMPYRRRAPTRYLLGAEYLMVGPAYWSLPARRTREQIGTVLVTLGGTDPQCLMPAIICCLQGVPGDFGIVAVLGPYFEHAAQVEMAAAASRRPATLVHAPASLCDLMLEADLAVSGAGQTLYELACTGCPTIALENSEDQEHQFAPLEQAGVIRAVRRDRVADRTYVQAVVASLAGDPAARRASAEAGRQLVDGRGASRVAEVIRDQIERRPGEGER